MLATHRRLGSSFRAISNRSADCRFRITQGKKKINSGSGSWGLFVAGRHYRLGRGEFDIYHLSFGLRSRGWLRVIADITSEGSPVPSQPWPGGRGGQRLCQVLRGHLSVCFSRLLMEFDLITEGLLWVFVFFPRQKSFPLQDNK